MTGDEVSALVSGDTVFCVDITIPEGTLHVDRYRVLLNHKRNLILERWPVMFPEWTSQKRIEKRAMNVFEKTPEAAVKAYVKLCRDEVRQTRTSYEMAQSMLEEALQFQSGELLIQ